MTTPTNKKIPISFLDLVPVPESESVHTALTQAVETAQTAEQQGFNRYWLAEHHNMPGIASSATAVLLSHIGAKTEKIRIGSGGIMLPNHSPLVVAEQFGTLATLYPNRVDLGVGRAPGTDGATFQALRRQFNDAERFPQDVQELQAFLDKGFPSVHAIPGEGTNVPIWMLGSSLFGAKLAGYLGLPYAFASHFAPDMLAEAVATYRQNFRPSASLDKPYFMLSANMLLAPTQAEADYHFTSVQQSFVRLRRGTPGQLPKPITDMSQFWTGAEQAMAQNMLRVSFVGTPDSVRPELTAMLERYQPDEMLVTCNIHDQATRLQSLKLVKEVGLFDLDK